jgi:hypothetical protein
MLLHCYRLGKYYSVGPDYFLAKPFSELFFHVEQTTKLAEKLQLEQSWDSMIDG